jgi:hypothetical protein
MNFVIGIIIWIILIIVCINIGKEKNRNGFLWGFFFGPFGLLILAILPKIEMRTTASTISGSNKSRTNDDTESYIPVFMRNEIEKPVSLNEIPKVETIISDENNFYDEDDPKKWICGKCGKINKMKDKNCKGCGREKGILKKNK